MLRKNFSFPVMGTVVLLLALCVVAGASQAQAESAGQLQYWVTMDQDAAAVCAQQGDLHDLSYSHNCSSNKLVRINQL